ncbi:DarT ssDNA thymidine ADP-ribosyltransferase family protein [Tissierella sp.]|uniref:DarT ssDNA thymidine ADP-ribosyltransferase family protein n=1 Tax=Tissierella sp. TaxID=41274 RepID=UPI0028A65B42|nr:DarT ssDNA thymidine ADP-ribosyltransferase family protein [Tissierella sp.]
MKIPNEHIERHFYHFTHIENIESIVKNGLLSTNKKHLNGIEHINLANESIQMRRSQMDVPCEPFGTIHDYVPFYFSSINPMLLGVLNRKNIDQPFVVFIAISINKLLESDAIFTDASANTVILPNFYQNPKDLNKLNWKLIDSNKWQRGTDDELHSRMAEVLIYKKVPIDWIESYIVFNDICRKEILRIYEENGHQKPKIAYEPFNGSYFYFTKFFIPERKNETLITGPIFLEHYYREAIKTIVDKREKMDYNSCSFINIDDALDKIGNNFCVIKELEDIFELETNNRAHSQNVSDHTMEVVKNLNNEYFNDLSDKDKKIVELSAYLHDIGKGPKSKWRDGIQPVYSDHPADAIPMVTRILAEEFKVLSYHEIKTICLLVIYHDLIGDILNNGRSEKELLNLEVSCNDFNMLIALSLADISAINISWNWTIQEKLKEFVEKIRKEIS